MLGNLTSPTKNNRLFLPPSLGGTSERSLCDLGPTVWCLSESNMHNCGVYNQTVGESIPAPLPEQFPRHWMPALFRGPTRLAAGVCGYASTLGKCTPDDCSGVLRRP